MQDLGRIFRADLDESARELRVGIAQLERLLAQFGAFFCTVGLVHGHVDELSASGDKFQAETEGRVCRTLGLS